MQISFDRQGVIHSRTKLGHWATWVGVGKWMIFWCSECGHVVDCLPQADYDQMEDDVARRLNTLGSRRLN